MRLSRPALLAVTVALASCTGGDNNLPTPGGPFADAAAAGQDAKHDAAADLSPPGPSDGGPACNPEECGPPIVPPGQRCAPSCQRNYANQCAWIIPPCVPIPASCTVADCTSPPPAPDCPASQTATRECVPGPTDACIWKVSCAPDGRNARTP